MQEEEIQDIFEMEQLEMESTLEYLQGRLKTIRAGKASPSMLDTIRVDYYGAPTPLKQVASVSTSDSRTLNVQPFEKSMIPVIEKAIFEANLGMTPQNNGEVVILNIPALTQERRKQLVKQVKDQGEEAKISIRSARKKLMDAVKKAVKDGYPEDAGKRKEEKAESMTKNHIEKIDQLVAAKEKDILTV
jgi:ribosome recycling factor